MYKQLLLTVILVLISAVLAFPQDLLLETHGVSPAAVKIRRLKNTLIARSVAFPPVWPLL